jgi:hypothetical protein
VLSPTAIPAIAKNIIVFVCALDTDASALRGRRYCNLPSRYGSPTTGRITLQKAMIGPATASDTRGNQMPMTQIQLEPSANDSALRLEFHY